MTCCWFCAREAESRSCEVSSRNWAAREEPMASTEAGHEYCMWLGKVVYSVCLHASARCLYPSARAFVIDGQVMMKSTE